MTTANSPSKTASSPSQSMTAKKPVTLTETTMTMTEATSSQPKSSEKVSSLSDIDWDAIASIKEGTRLSILWPLDNTYYNATVKDCIQHYFFLRYDDHETEWLDLTKHSFKILKDMDTKATTRKGGSLSPQKKASTKMPASKPLPSNSESSDASSKKRKSTSPQHWGKEEDEVLKQAVECFGTEDWDTVAAQVPGRNTKQVRERWQNYVDPNISFAPLTADEIRQVMSRQQELGNKWKEIATFLDQRYV